jgi:methyl-accepting chemotaxis protein
MGWFNNRKTIWKVILGTVVPLVPLAALGWISWVNVGSIQNDYGWIDHTNNVIGESRAIVGSAVDMETGMRGYLLAGKEDFLEPYQRGAEETYRRIDTLRETVNDNPRQVERLGEAENILREWQESVTEPTIALRRDIGDADTMNDLARLVGQERGKAYFDKFRGQIATFVEREEVLMEKRRDEFESIFAKLRRGGTGNIAGDLETMKEDENWVAHTYEVIGEARALLAAAVDMETGMRGYMLAGRDQFLEPYNAGSASFFAKAAKLKETVSDNPAQVQLLQETEATIREWQTAVVEPMIDLRGKIGDSQTMDDMADLVGEARGKAYFDKFRGVMAAFEQEESGLMGTRRAASDATVTQTYNVIFAGVTLGAVFGLFVAWLIGQGIAGPIAKMTRAMGELAGGNNDIEVPGVGRGDEVGDMASAVQVFKENAIEMERLRIEREEQDRRAEEEKRQSMAALADRFERQVKEVVDGVGSAATEMQATAQQMSATAEETSRQSANVASASDQATANVQTVAATAEELSASIAEIGRQVMQSAKISQNAVDEAESTNETVRGLAEAAARIGEVVTLINDIAGQTNLLALNATIEAARAGEAGKGFAVVAQEVKNLANQTAKATEEISSQIGAVQEETNDAVGAIDKIRGIIGEVNDIATTISSAVEEQGVSTQEIARNVQQAAQGTQDVNSNIESVSRAAGETGTAANQVLNASQEMAQQAEGLRGEVDRFLAEVRAA